MRKFLPILTLVVVAAVVYLISPQHPVVHFRFGKTAVIGSDSCIGEGAPHSIDLARRAAYRALKARTERSTFDLRPLDMRDAEHQMFRTMMEHDRILAAIDDSGCPYGRGMLELGYSANERETVNTIDGRPGSRGATLGSAADDDVDQIPQIEFVLGEMGAIDSTSDEPSASRDVDRLVFSGVESFDVAEIRKSFAMEFDLILAAHPRSDMFEYMKKLESVALNAYRYNGFPQANVEICFNNTRHQFEVHVKEGTRFRCGEVQVSGCKNLSADALVRALTDETRPSLIVWRSGAPVQFDDEAVDRIRKKIESESADAGFFHPAFDVAIDAQPETATGILRVTVLSEGPRALIGNIEVTGSKRDSRDDVLKYLDLHPGAPFDSDTRYRLSRRLADSARYLSHEVKDEHAGMSADAGHELYDLIIHLRDYAKARHLHEELPPAEQALLKFRDWMRLWSQGQTGEDLVVTMSYAAEGATGDSVAEKRKDTKQPALSLLDFRMIVSPTHGQTITLKAKPMAVWPLTHLIFAAYPDRLVLAAPQRKAKLVLPNSAQDRLVLRISGESASEKLFDRDGHSFRLNVGMGVSNITKPTASPFEVQADFSAAFMTSIAHQDNLQCLLRDGTWHISGKDFEIQFDAESGRLVEYRYSVGDGIPALICRSQKQALDLELQSLERTLADLPMRYDGDSPWVSLCQFVADEVNFVAGPLTFSELGGSLRAVRKLLAHWSPPGFGALWDGDGNRTSTGIDSFWMPSHRVRWSNDEFLKQGSQTQKGAMGLFLSIYRRFVPTTGWMWPVGRDAALHWVSNDSPAGASLRSAPSSVEIGPSGELFLGFLSAYLDVDLTEIAGRTGLHRLTEEAFAKDYRPLLEGDSWLGQWLLSLAAALRELDDAEIKALVRLLPEDARRKAIVSGLALLKKDPDQPVKDVLPAVLDRIWSDALCEYATAVFINWLPKPIEREHRDDQVRPASALDSPAETSGTDHQYDALDKWLYSPKYRPLHLNSGVD